MPTARARMLELSPLASGAIARAHFLAITLGQGGGTGETGETVFVPALPGLSLPAHSGGELELIEAPQGVLEMVAQPAILELEPDNETMEVSNDDAEIMLRDC